MFRNALLLLSSLVLVFAAMPSAASQSTCNTNVINRNGNEVNLSTNKLANVFNQRLRSAHSKFQDLQLTPESGNKLKISGKKSGKSISISGPLKVTSNGGLELHANHIKENGAAMKTMMSVFGKDLADEVNLKHTQSLSVQGNNLRIHLQPLLGLSGRVQQVNLQGSEIQLRFASQPCQ